MSAQSHGMRGPRGERGQQGPKGETGSAGPAYVTWEQWKIAHDELTRRTFRWIAVLFIVVIGALAGLGFAISGNQDAIHQIQQSRLQNCLNTDRNHDKTVATLDYEIKTTIAGAPPSKRASLALQLHASRAFTVALINTLQPHTNCYARITPPSPHS